MVDQVRIKTAVDVKGIVIGKVCPFGNAQALEFAVEDGQVIGDVVADDDGVFGKGQELCQGFLRRNSFSGQFFVADVVDVVCRADGAAGLYIGVELILYLPLGIEANGGDLDDFILRRVRTRTFDVEDDQPFLG